MGEYVVTMQYGDAIWIALKNPPAIIEDISMHDCYDYDRYRVYGLYRGEMVEFIVHGTWSDAKDPLYIWLERPDGTEEFDGYGKDH